MSRSINFLRIFREFSEITKLKAMKILTNCRQIKVVLMGIIAGHTHFIAEHIM